MASTNGNTPIGDGAVLDPDLLRKSVTREEVIQAKATYMWFGSFLLPTPLISLPPDPPTYYTRDGDAVLLSTIASEDKWGDAVGIASTKCASLDYDIEGDVPLRRNRMHNILAAVDGMQGWTPFIAKQMQDFLCTNNGEFIEIVRGTKAVGARIIGLLHLDSRRCFRTGDPDIPVLYRDRVGYVHEMRSHQIIALADMPTPRLTYNGVGFCAAMRVYRTIYRMAAIEQYIAEKVTGRKPLKVTLVSGMTQKQVQEIFKASQEEANARGLVSYMGAAVSAVPTDGDIKTVEIELSGLPDNFDLEKERNNARLEYANAIGLDIQDLQPGQIGGSLGSSTQSVVLNDKAKGKGLSYWRKAFGEQMNLKVFPDATVFLFIEKDYRDEQAEAAASLAREQVRASMIASGEISARQGLQMAVDADDAPRQFIAQDETQQGTISSDEKPVDEAAMTGTDVAAPVQPQPQAAQGQPQPATPAQPPQRVATKETHTGAMVALCPSNDIAGEIAATISDVNWPEGTKLTPPSEYHVTLAYLGDAATITPDERTRMIAQAKRLATMGFPAARFNGIARFNGSDVDGDAIVVLLSSQTISDMADIARNQIGNASEHTFNAHMTLAYIPKDAPTPTVPLPFDVIELPTLAIVFAGETTEIPIYADVARIKMTNPFASAFKAYRTELARVTPTMRKVTTTDEAALTDYYRAATKELRGYMRILAATCRELCADETGTLKASIRPQVINPDTAEVEGVLYAGNQVRPEVVVRSNLYGRRGFSAKDPNGALAFAVSGETIFRKHVAGAAGNDWFSEAWKQTESERRAMAQRIGALSKLLIDKRDVLLMNAPHIDGYDSSAAAQ